MSAPWNITKNALVFGLGLNNTMTIHFDDGDGIKKVEGSLFKMSDADEEIMIKDDADFYVLKYEEIRFAAVKVK
ncbi:hypothetical protein [Salicibibacter kimchii]|uniref:Uncharacterized protein n=1 Tax=Salicibibacter kimchii TaxID=2099786 RepID=A0A345BUL1_9BACI|nr:hypothetical protein [Salicibibacter kimchii]AXF54642.1 hypothetical protein DT065_00505 [Salicibibacter kimchii]